MEKDDKIVVQNKNMTTIKQRKNYQSDFKAKVAWAAVTGRLTLNGISKQFALPPNQLSTWKKQFLESLPQIFANSKSAKTEADDELVNQLYQQIGKLKVELDWLKKKSAFFQ